MKQPRKISERASVTAPTARTKTVERYRKIEARMWGDAKFRALTPLAPSGQALWIYLITGPHTGPIPGLFKAGPAAMAEDLGWEREAFDKAFAEVFREGLAKADLKARLVWIPNGVKFNPPASPNVVLSWATEMDLLPECDLKAEALAAIRASVFSIGETFGKAFDEASGKALRKPSAKLDGKTSRNQEQEQDKEQKEERSSPDRVSGYGSVGRDEDEIGQVVSGPFGAHRGAA